MSKAISEMGKTELRAAMKEAGISYSNMTVARMRAALMRKEIIGSDAEVRHEHYYPHGENFVTLGEAKADVATTPLADEAKVFADADHNGAGAKVLTTAHKVPHPKGEVRNGITRPRAGGKCAAVWDAMEALYQQTGNVPTNKDATEWATANGANISNTQQELARWRKWAGLVKPKASAI